MTARGFGILPTGEPDRIDPEAEIDEADDDRPEGLEELTLLVLGEIAVGEHMLVERHVEGQNGPV
ncbi:hypothetical protein CH339_11810 [Rhodobium orientis]|uniref:Uncharacterized protein n=1 Tax=Rhodobium orientis TaxID=34017 RepID=A0A327JQ75_9HYPH|nr:hypothetical protein [Rhodobium orientis]RAI27022.1 hypothetical protein CH339_11810 [Rhodobium orientis]